jgi:hypothetical protein
LDLDPHQVYYLLVMGEIEAVKFGRAWRLEPEALKEYDKQFPKKPHRKSSGNFVYTGDGGFLFRSLPGCLPAYPGGEAAGMERRRRPLVHSAGRSQTVLLKELKPVAQLELFAG